MGKGSLKLLKNRHMIFERSFRWKASCNSTSYKQLDSLHTHTFWVRLIFPLSPNSLQSQLETDRYIGPPILSADIW